MKKVKITKMKDKMDYWLMFIEGDITLETLIELINDYV